MASPAHYDAIVVGGGHNGLVAATLLARAGRTVLVLERRGHTGGAATSGAPFPGVDARLSRYAYLVSLFPSSLIRALGVDVTLRPRAIDSYTPCGTDGLLVTRGGDGIDRRWRDFHATLQRLAARVFPTLTEPLRSREELRALIGDDEAWNMVFEQPLSAALEQRFDSDLVRGLVLTDATIGTFAPADDPLLRQNRCFLYHVIGNGTGRWDVPVGGMGAVAAALEQAARAAGAEIRTEAEVVGIDTDGLRAEVLCGDGRRSAARDLLAGIPPAQLARLLGVPETEPRPEGSQLKVNLLLRRLPRLRDRRLSPKTAFAGTFHVNERYDQLAAAHAQASAGRIPSTVPCELYCHSLSDPTILGPELRAAGAQTVTVFALHMPARLFHVAGGGATKQDAVAATLRSIDSVLDEPIEECLWTAPDGSPCVEAVTPPELEEQLQMPGGHIFHRDLSWPYAEAEDDVGRWGVETEHPNVWLCGAGARRGGGVSGIPGHNAARAVLEARRAPSPVINRTRSRSKHA